MIQTSNELFRVHLKVQRTMRSKSDVKLINVKVKMRGLKNDYLPFYGHSTDAFDSLDNLEDQFFEAGCDDPVMQL
jgi:hypothetical protein